MSEKKTRLDLIGRTFGKLTVIEFAELRKSHSVWRCLCVCGHEVLILGHSLMKGNTKSCGCLKLDGSGHRKHGYTSHRIVGRQRQTKVYACWQSLKRRCLNPKVASYKNYGGRGITVCDRWRYSFENFLSDIGEPPTPQHSIDRFPNNDGNYEPGNCRWATAKEQANNKRSNCIRILKPSEFVGVDHE